MKTELLIRVLASLRTQIAVKMYALLGIMLHHMDDCMKDELISRNLDDAQKSLQNTIINLDFVISRLNSVSDK